MKLKDITLHNISNYIEGNFKWLGDQFNMLSSYTKEQILWRASNCPPSCAKNRKCEFCGCDYPQKLYVRKSCNKDKKLPNLMEEQDWINYKQKLKNDRGTNKLS